MAATISSATPLLLAATGEVVAERAGVLNLGLEGMMLVGAVGAFATASATGSTELGIGAGLLAGTGLAVPFAFITLTLAANQVASGLALTIFGSGLSSLVGGQFIGRSVTPLPPVLMGQNALVYLSIAITAVVAWGLQRTRAGLVMRAVGENAHAAHALGYDVIGIRRLAVLFGGAMSGLAGAYLSLAATPMWADGLTAGRGWIALALVVFGAWRPWRVLGGAYLFGGISVLQFFMQGAGFVPVPTQLLAMLPYLATLLVLAAMSLGRTGRRVHAPACLGKPFSVGP